MLAAGWLLSAASMSGQIEGQTRHPIAVAWHSAAAGVDVAEIVLDAPRVGARTRVIVARVDPSRVTLQVEVARRDDGRGAWTVDSTPRHAIVSLNAGQFATYDPWGWLVQNGHELKSPGAGPLSAALVVDRSGAARMISVDSIPAVRARATVAQAIQSYPVLLQNGELPRQLTTPGNGVDLEHRDARLALGVLADGRLLVALTRFEMLGSAFGSVPLGPTIPEMAGIMRDLGCRSAMSLDGGISAQLLLRDHGRTRVWRGYRAVPVALIARPR